MTIITPIRRTNPEGAATFLADIPDDAKFDRKRFRKSRDLPEILEFALALILKDLDASPGEANPGAVGCRLLAYCVRRLKD
jgi:hypothetical protein